jgi:hypothetical protein
MKIASALTDPMSDTAGQEKPAAMKSGDHD